MDTFYSMTPSEQFEQVCGLNEQDREYLCRCFNGIYQFQQNLPMHEIVKHGLAKQWLVSCVSGNAQEAHADIAHSEVWLETYSPDQEQPYKLHDLYEKMQKLDDVTCACLLFYIQGWYDRVEFDRRFEERDGQ